MLNALQLVELEEIEGLHEQEQEEARQRFKIENTEQLAWALRKLAAIKAKENEVRRLADAERQRISDWEQKELTALERDRSFFEGLIAEYAAKQREADPKWKASTPYGRVSFRRQPAKWEWKDDASLVAFLEANGHDSLVRVKKEPDKNAVKKAFQTTADGKVVDPNTGEVVPGVVVVPQPEKLVIDVG